MENRDRISSHHNLRYILNCALNKKSINIKHYKQIINQNK